MASNYYGYNYGSSSYPQNQQQFSDQYSSTAPAAAAPASQASQTYYPAGQSQPRQTASAARQPVAADNRSNTTQYNGLHFPAPAPARQTVAPTSHDLGHLTGSAVNAVGSSGGGVRSNASAMGNAKGYGSAGHYQSAGKQSASQSRQRTDAVSGQVHDRAEHALSASTGWNAGTSAATSSIGHATPAVSSADYGYSYNKPNITPSQQQSQQQNYYAPQRTSTTPSTAAQTTSYNNSAPRSSSATSKQSSQRQSNQGYGQTAQTSSKASYAYETPSVKTNTSNTAPAYQQAAECGKTYNDDADQNQSYLHRVYTLPQPTPTRNATDNSTSYFPNTHTTEPPYNNSSQTSKSAKPSTMAQTTSYSKHAQDLERGSSATATSAPSYSYSELAPAPAQSSQQQYYQDYGSANAPQYPATSYNNVTASAASTAPAAPTPKPNTNAVPASQPSIVPTSAAKKPRKPRQSVSQKSPTKKTPKSRALKNSKGSAASPPASVVPDPQQPESLPAQHMFYPSDSKAGKSSTKSGASQSTAMHVDMPHEQSLSPDPLGGSDMHTMEQHMREMVEKMREYQSKDPTAFQQVWENVKRGNPTAMGGKGVAPKSTPGVDSPRQVVANLAKPSATDQSTPADAGKHAVTPGSAASQAQKTVWPSSQKVALSKTVSTFLINLRQSCSESYAMSLLDYGPTFAELCQKLENQGYRFERNDLARVLLKTSESVDPAKSASTASPAISAAPPSSDVPRRTMAPQSMKSFNPRNIKDSITNLIPQDHHNDHSQNFVTPSLVYREVSYPTHFGQPESNVRSDAPTAPPTPAPVPIPNTHTIVEKPAQDLGKRHVSLAKKSQKSSSSKAPQTTQTPKAPQALQTAHPGPESQAPVAPQPSFPPALREEPMPDASPLTITVTQPISRYEDLIQASSPHNPFVRPQAQDDSSALEKLQSKLEAQMSQLKKLEEPVELPSPSVFIPSQSAPLSPPLPPPPSRKPAWPRAPTWNRKDALRRNTYESPTIVHSVLQATGRHPQYEGLNSSLAILRRLHPGAFDNITDVAAIPWDIYDPPPASLPGEERKTKRSVIPEGEEKRGRKREAVSFNGIPRAEPVLVPTVTPGGKVRGKRGRPRGSRGTPRSTRGRGGTTVGGSQVPNTDTNAAGDPSTAANAHRYGTVTRVNINTLRNGGSASTRGNSGRKRKYGDSPDPHYPSDGNGGAWGDSPFQTLPVFKCQWEQCNQELQNLETLRKHLVKKHKVENTQGVLPCCWGNCGTLMPVGRLDPKTGQSTSEQRRRRLHFGTGIAWDSHVLGEHLKVVREQLGDGMSVSAARSLSRDSSAHSVEGRLRSMSIDRAGRSLTPVITQAPHGYKFTPPPGFSGGTQFKLAHEFPEEVNIETDADEQKFLGDELARIGRTGAGTESMDIPDLPGLESDNAEGWAIKLKKLTADLSKATPLPPKVWTESGDGSGHKGKGRADD
ncbi:hypothetical protein TWF506_001988 [Arthrobotrys conoides]|uniref:C2H2-type domain-containing protein n=1 Tax=Arthrobotrys conoides TaxID=74498 RepID=A0AAN8NHD4_9PEZI